MTGYSIAAHLGRTPRELMPEIADAVEAILRRVVETGNPVFDAELHGETPAWPGVRRVWITHSLPQKDTTGKVVAINVVVEDGTGRKRIERRLRRQIEELQAVFDAVPAAVFIARDPDCRTMVGNRVTEQLLRLPHGAEVSKSAGTTAPKNFKVFQNGGAPSPPNFRSRRPRRPGCRCVISN
jgi:PAS domain-containing protein